MKTTVSLFLVLVLSACSIPRTKNEDSILCNDSIKFSALIAATINQKNFQRSSETQKLFGQEDFIILNNDERFNKLGSLRVNGCAVRALSEREIMEQDIRAYFIFLRIHIIGDSAFVYCHYNIRGDGLEGTFRYKNYQWENDSVDFFNY